ncbi:MAG: nitrile hydratase subunit beta [Pseudomonadota bacterium]
MDGVHDMGGMHGFGAVPYEKDDPAFHHDWERRVWGLCQSTSLPDFVNLDYDRHNLERMPPAHYLSQSYFERWLYNLTTMLLAGDFVSLEEVEKGKAALAGVQGSAQENGRRDDAAGPESADPFAHEVYRRDVSAEAQFKIGDGVMTGSPGQSGHTRLPRYARRKSGQIHLHHGAHVLPDSNAANLGEAPTHLYTVAFTAQELWGEGASARDKVFLDIWECHLTAA